MERVVPFSELPGHENVSKFEGREHGSATFTVDGEQIEADAGEIVVVSANAVHGFVSSGEETPWQTGIHPSDHVIQEDLEP